MATNPIEGLDCEGEIIRIHYRPLSVTQRDSNSGWREGDEWGGKFW